jgi:hypothetical protein
MSLCILDSVRTFIRVCSLITKVIRTSILVHELSSSSEKTIILLGRHIVIFRSRHKWLLLGLPSGPLQEASRPTFCINLFLSCPGHHNLLRFSIPTAVCDLHKSRSFSLSQTTHLIPFRSKYFPALAIYILISK